MSFRFALTGAAGYIAPKHMKAIIDTGNVLVATLDPHDSVGILDRFAPEARFFSEPERFDRYLEKLKRKGDSYRIHWMSICSPNYLHDAHIRIALRVGADAICEKPLVLNPWNLDALQELEIETGRRVFCTLQLRQHPDIINLRKREQTLDLNQKREIDLTYITPRGAWYLSSWKGNLERSGGLISNIGVHFFDMLMWIYGSAIEFEVHLSERKRTAGFLELERANVRWFLSIDSDDIAFTEGDGSGTFRSITIDGKELNFSGGFSDLHTEAYRAILEGNGTTIGDCRKSVQLVHDIRNSLIVEPSENVHKFLATGSYLS